MTRFALVLSILAPLSAQVLPFNAAGVTMGHHHIITPDVDAQKKIWVEALGGQLSGNPGLEFVKFPGTFLILSKGNATQGTEGSAIDHLAFDVKDLKATHDKLQAAGVKFTLDEAGRCTALLPGGLKVEFIGTPTLSTPIANRAIGFSSIDPDAERAWWEKVFRGETTKEGQRVVTTIPGVRLIFAKAATAPAKTQGRTLDHTGVGVKNVDEYCKKLAGMGVMCERSGATIAMVTSPAGVRVEINQGLESR
jgi:catechol 2,3-dioxygenase-like lactoylglutathione lyase family enzyme